MRGRYVRWDAAWCYLVKLISGVNIRGSRSAVTMTPLLSQTVNINLDIYLLKSSLTVVRTRHCTDPESLCWGTQCWVICHIYQIQLLLMDARVSPNEVVVWQTETECHGENRLDVWRRQKDKRSFVASTEGYKPCDGWATVEKSADLAPPLPPNHPHWLFFSCTLLSFGAFSIWSVRREGGARGPCITAWSCTHNLVY